MDDLVHGSDSWFLCGFLRRLMAIVGRMRADALSVVTNQLIVDLFSSAAAFGGLFNQVTVLAAAAAAAATVGVHALSSLDKSAAGANDDENVDFLQQAPGAAAAAIVIVHALSSLDESAAGATADELLVFMVQAAVAWAAALFVLHALFFLDESAAEAKNCVMQAAAAFWRVSVFPKESDNFYWT